METIVLTDIESSVTINVFQIVYNNQLICPPNKHSSESDSLFTLYNKY